MLDGLVDALRRLPGVGPKSAQRMALHLLQRDRESAKRLGEALIDAVARVRHCERCRNLTDEPLCRWCRDPDRRDSELCVVENPADVLAIDRATDFGGRFFLLLGRLSPLDGVGPAELGLDRLAARLAEGDVEELTLALSATVEGQATSRYVESLATERGVRVWQLARGLPAAGELEFADGSTLAVAFADRHSRTK